MGKWKLARVGGIDIYLHWTLALLAGGIGVSALADGSGTLGLVAGLLQIAALLSMVTLHELGHAQAARAFGIGTRDITLLPIGGVARLEGLPRDPRAEMVIAAAGPAVNLVLAAFLSLALVLLDPVAPYLALFFVHALIVWNLVLAMFNLLPAFPMDGGRILRAWLARRDGLARATETACRVSRWVSVGIGLWGLVTFNFWLVMLAGYVALAASMERAQLGYFGGVSSVVSRPGARAVWVLGRYR